MLVRRSYRGVVGVWLSVGDARPSASPNGQARGGGLETGGLAIHLGAVALTTAKNDVGFRVRVVGKVVAIVLPSVGVNGLSCTLKGICSLHPAATKVSGNELVSCWARAAMAGGA